MDKQNVTCFILLLNPCLKKHNKNVYKSYFYAFLKTRTWIFGDYPLYSGIVPYGM